MLSAMRGPQEPPREPLESVPLGRRPSLTPGRRPIPRRPAAARARPRRKRPNSLKTCVRDESSFQAWDSYAQILFYGDRSAPCPREMETKMSALPVTAYASAHAGNSFAMNTMRSRPLRQGSFVLAVTIALAAAAGTASPAAAREHPIVTDTAGP